MCGCGYGCGCRCRWVWLCTMGVRVGVRMCVGCGGGGGGCVVVILFLLETGYEPQQKGDCRFTYVCQTFARATHLSDSLCLSDYVCVLAQALFVRGQHSLLAPFVHSSNRCASALIPSVLHRQGRVSLGCRGSLLTHRLPAKTY